jgi:hypothetical protein
VLHQAAEPSPGSLARFAAIVLAAFYLPPLLIVLGLIPFAYRFVVLVAVAAALGVVALLRGTPGRELGLHAVLGLISISVGLV